MRLSLVALASARAYDVDNRRRQRQHVRFNEESPELRVGPFALAWTENLPAPQLMLAMAPVGDLSALQVATLSELK